MRAAWVLGLLVSLLLALCWPMLLTTSGFGGDWEHHLWFVWHQSLAIRADGVPSLFLNTRSSVLYPLYAFYGGTIFAIAGGLAVLPGSSPIAAYVLTYMLGFAAAYGGWYWLSRTAGLGRWWAQVPGLLFVTAAYYLTLAYGQGDWPEFIALSTLPLLLASGLAVLRAERLRLLPATALAASGIVFFGSHILTVLWGSTLLALVAVAVLVTVPESRRDVSPRSVLRVLAVAIPAALVSAWFLAPMIAYSSQTLIGSDYSFAYRDLRETMQLVAFPKLFSFSRASTLGVPDYVLSLPMATIVWLLSSIVVLLAALRRGIWVRLLGIFAMAAAAVIVLMTHADLLLALPKPYTLLQFSYRLEAYVLMALTAAVLVVLAAARSHASRLRLWAWTVIPVLIVSVLGGVEQVEAYPRTPQPRDRTFTSAYEAYAELYTDYADIQLPEVPEQHLQKLAIPLSAIHDNRVSLSVRDRPGLLLDTNIGGAPNLLKITGATVYGQDQKTHLVLALDEPPASSSAPSASNRTTLITIAPAKTGPVVVGRLLTLAALAVLVVELGLLSLASFSLRRRSRSRGAHAVRAG